MMRPNTSRTRLALSDSGLWVSIEASMLKPVSIIGYVAMVGGLLGLLFTRSFLSTSPLVIVPQVAALSHMKS